MSNKSLVSCPPLPVSPPAAPDPPLPPPEALPSAVLPWCHARVLVCAFTAGTPQAAGLKDFPIITTKSFSWAVSRRPGPFLGARLSAALCSSPPHICSSQTGFPPLPAQPSASKALRALRFHFPLSARSLPGFSLTHTFYILLLAIVFGTLSTVPAQRPRVLTEKGTRQLSQPWLPTHPVPRPRVPRGLGQRGLCWWQPPAW